MKRVALYYRVSTERQDLESQKNAVEDWLENLPAEKKPSKIHVFKDEGISGASNNRPGLNKLLELAFSGKIDTIIVYRLDRFSRHAATAIRLILSLDESGVAFVSVTQPVLNLGHENPFRRTMLAAFAEIAEIERETIVARVVAGLNAAKKRGVKLGPPVRISSDMRTKIFELRKTGSSIRKIASELQISTGSISKILNQNN